MFNFIYQDGWSCLHATIEKENLEMFEILIENNADVNIQDNVFFFIFFLFYIYSIFNFFFYFNQNLN
jgi:hypothetical protein